MKKDLRTRIAVATAACMVLGVFGMVACTAKPAPEPTPTPEPTPAVDPEPEETFQVDARVYADKYPNEYLSWATSSETEYTVVGGLTIHGKIWAGHDAIYLYRAANISLSCVGCHSSEMVKLVHDNGDQVANLTTADYDVAVVTGITCYSCHGNTPGEMVVVKSWIAEAAEKGGIETADVNLVCAQCHNAPDWNNIDTNSDPASWTMLSVGTSADAVYEYFLAEGSASPMVLATENEFAQYYGSTMEKAGATCANCHMEAKTDASGNAYMNHVFTSVGHTEALWNNCLTCHTDSVEARQAAVAQVKAEYTASLDAATAAVAALDAAIKAAPAGTDTTAAVALYNKASFYLIWGTDVASGVHSIGNQPMRDTLTQAIDFANEGLALLK